MAKTKKKSKPSEAASSKVPSSWATSPSVVSGPVTSTSTDNVTAGVAAMDLGPTDTPPSTMTQQESAAPTPTVATARMAEINLGATDTPQSTKAKKKKKKKKKSSKVAASSAVDSSNAASSSAGPMDTPPSTMVEKPSVPSISTDTAGMTDENVGSVDTPPPTKAKKKKKKKKSKSKSKSSKVEVDSSEVASSPKGPTAGDAEMKSAPTDTPSSTMAEKAPVSSTSTDQAAKATTMGPIPIDLGSLTVFLRYVLNMVDYRFAGTCLVETSLIDGKVWESETLQRVLEAVKDKGLNKEFYSFLHLSHEVSDVNPIVFSHPSNKGDSKKKIDQFERGIREYIYNVSRSSEKSDEAIAVFQEFFKGFSPDQTLSIQVGGGEPIVVKATDARVLEVKLFRTKNLVISTVMKIKEDEMEPEEDKMELLDYGVGHIEGVSHYLLMFLIPGVVQDPGNTGNNIAVVDMTSMQFGLVGLGFHELFIMETLDQWRAKISGYAGHIEKVRVAKTIPRTAEVMLIADWVAKCAWETIGRGFEWCRFCGMSESDKIPLYQCELCNNEKLKYCYWHQGDEFHHHQVEEAKAGDDKGKGKEKA